MEGILFEGNVFFSFNLELISFPLVLLYIISFVIPLCFCDIQSISVGFSDRLPVTSTNIFVVVFALDILLMFTHSCLCFFINRCIPHYWKVKDMSNLSDSKKREANELNKNMLSQLSKDFDCLTDGKTADGQIFIRLGVVRCALYLLLFSHESKEVFYDLRYNAFIPWCFANVGSSLFLACSYHDCRKESHYHAVVLVREQSDSEAPF